MVDLVIEQEQHQHSHYGTGGCFSSQAAAPLPGPTPVPAAESQSQDLISQGQQAIGLIDGIYKLVEPHVLDAKNTGDETNNLKRLIGPWWKEAFEKSVIVVTSLSVSSLGQALIKTI